VARTTTTTTTREQATTKTFSNAPSHERCVRKEKACSNEAGAPRYIIFVSDRTTALLQPHSPCILTSVFKWETTQRWWCVGAGALERLAVPRRVVRDDGVRKGRRFLDHRNHRAIPALTKVWMCIDLHEIRLAAPQLSQWIICFDIIRLNNVEYSVIK
jgi:hypothetical protein